VAAAGALVPDLAAGGNFDSFAQSLMGFLFWHLANSFKIIYLRQFGKYKIDILRYLQPLVNTAGSILGKKEKLAYDFCQIAGFITTKRGDVKEK